ncbi:MAG TPA: phosphatidylserine decarboxylase [Steroidobacteraceae bacterium]
MSYNFNNPASAGHALRRALFNPHAFLCWAILCLGLHGPFANAQSSKAGDAPATIELRHLVATNPEIKQLIIASIERAKRVNPDPLTNPVQTLEQYLQFISWVERGLPASLIEPKPHATLYQRIDQSLCYLFFISDQPLQQLEGRGYFNNSLQYVEPYTTWFKSFVRSWGAFLDSPASWNAESLRLALADPVFGLNRGWYEDPSHWTTFNQFFVRRLKSADQRPIAAPEDGAVIVSPVDAIPEGAWTIDTNSHVIEKSGVPVKSATVQSVDDLLGARSHYRGAFAGGSFTHLFLDVGDYHRYHFPLGGVVKEVAIIPGQELSGGYVTWDPVNKRYAFDPSSIGWQSLETRGCVILQTPEFGLVALLPIGMSPVSSVNFDPGVKEGARIRKGDSMGHFLFGGSDFVLLFQAGYELTLDSPRDAHHGFSHLLMGERLGHLRRTSAAASNAAPSPQAAAKDNHSPGMAGL